MEEKPVIYQNGDEITGLNGTIQFYALKYKFEFMDVKTYVDFSSNQDFTILLSWKSTSLIVRYNIHSYKKYATLTDVA